MKLKKRKDGGYELISDHRKYALWLGMLAAICVAISIYYLIKKPNALEQLTASITASIIFLIAFLFSFDHTIVVFNSQQKLIVWQRKSTFSRSNGRIAFEEVELAFAEASTAINKNRIPYRRIVLKTMKGPIPLTRSYSPDPRGKIIRIAAKLSTLFSHSRAEEITLKIRALIQSGRETDAIHFIAEKQGISLAQAELKMHEIKRTPPRTPPAQTLGV